MEIPTKNWRIVFSVPLNNIPVEPGTADHDTIMGEIGSDKPGDYSISRLVMDFQSECQVFPLVNNIALT